MVRVLIADKFPEKQRQQLMKDGFSINYQPELTAETLPEAIGVHHILCVRSTRVTEQTIHAAEKLVMIVRVGSGVNTIAVEEASRQGVYVANCPGKNAIAVAELTLGLLLAADRRIPQASESLKEGRWEKKVYAQADGLFGKTMGIVGLGQIGREVARRASAFGLKLVSWSKDFSPEFNERYKIRMVETVEELIEVSDIISVHLPLLDSTRNMFGAEQFASMKPGTIFLNTSRGGIHDEEALYHAASEQGLRFGLDVFVEETSPFTSPLRSLPSFVGTPHIGASTAQAQGAVADETVRILTMFLHTGVVLNCINLQRNPPVRCQLIVRHFNHVGVLASVLTALQKDNINVEGMSNTVFEGEEAAVASIRLNQAPSDELLDKIKHSSSSIIQVAITPPAQ